MTLTRVTKLSLVGVTFDPTKAKAKAARKYAAILKRWQDEAHKITQAGDYHCFPTIVQIGEAVGSQSAPSLRGTNKERKPKAPKLVIEASGRHNAAIIKCLHELNKRREEMGLLKFDVKVTDVVFTEFRNGTPKQVIRLMVSQGYIPAGPGVFVKAKDKKTGEENPFAKWILSEVVSTGQDLRSYGRSWTTSPALEMISKDIPIHYTDLKALGLETDGTSLFTQGMSGEVAAAFQWRSATVPQDMRTPVADLDGNTVDLESGIIKGLAVGAKILKNVTAGEVTLVSREFWDELKEQCPELWHYNCPVVNHNGLEWQSGFFVDRKNMTKGPGKTQAAHLADGFKVTTVTGSNYVSFIIAEMKDCRTSIGWQTTQLIHKLIVENHKGEFRAFIDKRIANLADRGLDNNTLEALNGPLGQIATEESDTTAIALMQQLSGKATGHLAFGGGLSGITNYVVEFNDLPAGWGVGPVPQDAIKKAKQSSKAPKSFMSRYPQQGFESLVVLKNLTMRDVGELYNALEQEGQAQADALCRLPRYVQDFYGALRGHIVNQGVSCPTQVFNRAKSVVSVMRSMLPFVKKGGYFVSHADQFLKLRGDADGDKNFWTFEPWLVAVMQEVSDVVRELEIPRLEIKGDGVSLGDNFSKKSYWEVMNSDDLPPQSKLRIAELICARNNGQGPVGLIANLSTLPLSRLKWSIVDGKLVWQTKGAREFFAYLLLMQQTAIDMQKRIYPAPSLLRWRMARLFMSKDDTSEDLVPPSLDKDVDEAAHYQRLLPSEAIWTMSAKWSIRMEAYEDGLMYNERVLSHWAAWVLNGLILDVDFLAMDDKRLEALSMTLATKGPQAFFELVAQKTEKSLDEIVENWVMPEDLISWKKGANLTEVVGTPAAGLQAIWEQVIDSYAKIKTSRNLRGEPLEHLASAFKRFESVAKGGINGIYKWVQDGVTRADRLGVMLDTEDLRALYRAFASVTDAESTEVAESERMQGDTIKSSSDAKRAILAAFDHTQWTSYSRRGSWAASLTQGGSVNLSTKVGFDKVSVSVLTNGYGYRPEKRIAMTTLILKLLVAKLCELANSAGYANESSGWKMVDNLVKKKLLDQKAQPVAICPDGITDAAWEQLQSKYEHVLGHFNELLAGDKYRKLCTAFSRYDLPVVRDKGALGLSFSGNGWGGEVYSPLFKDFLRDLSKVGINPADKQLAEWVADTMIPAYSLGLSLATEQENRQSLISDSALTEEELFEADPNVKTPSLSQMQLLSKDKIEDHIWQRLDVKNLLLHGVKKCHTNKNIVAWVKGQIIDAWDNAPTGIDSEALETLCLQAWEPAPEEQPVLGKAKAALSDLLDNLHRASFYREVKAYIRPLMGAIRLKNWWGRWADYFNMHDAAKTAWINGKVSASMFNNKIEIPQDGSDPRIVDRWLKSRIEFAIPSLWTGSLIGQALADPESDFSGIYLLCQEKNVSRWSYFDALTMRLALRKGGIIKKYLMVHLDPNNGIYLGNAYHRTHYQNSIEMLPDGKQIKIEGIKKPIEHKDLKVWLTSVNNHLVPHVFEYELKPEKGQKPKRAKVSVYLPFFYGANNKLSSMNEAAKWFYSSKLWSVLFSLDIPGIQDKDAMGQVFEAFWGFKYPSKYKKNDAASLYEGTNSNMVPKVPLDWLKKELSLDQTRRDLLTAVAGYSSTPGADWRKIGGTINGFMPWQEAAERVVSYYYNYKTGSLNKALLALMGLSSVEYQFDNLRKDSGPNEYKKYIERAWANTPVSGLRALFGAIGVGTTWQVENCYYVSSGLYGSKDHLESLLKAFSRPKGVVKVRVEAAAERYNCETETVIEINVSDDLDPRNK